MVRFAQRPHKGGIRDAGAGRTPVTAIDAGTGRASVLDLKFALFRVMHRSELRIHKAH
jgi:hypothetical protein